MIMVRVNAQLVVHGWRRSAVAQRNRKRHHDHARKRKIDIHEGFVRRFSSGVILKTSDSNKKFQLMI
jgi:hypothetical protein